MPIHECKNTDVESSNKWYSECEKKGLPFVVVYHRSKYSKVEWDYLTIPKEKDELLRSKAEEVRKSLLSIFQSSATEKSTYDFSALLGKFDYLTPENASKAAGMVYDVLSKAISV
jgi:hypothetical protein